MLAVALRTAMANPPQTHTRLLDWSHLRSSGREVCYGSNAVDRLRLEKENSDDSDIPWAE